MQAKSAETKMMAGRIWKANTMPRLDPGRASSPKTNWAPTFE